MNPYLKNLQKIEFVVTYACTGRCRHCSEGDHSSFGVCIDPEIAAKAVRESAARYALATAMTFGGEPLLYPEVVYAVHRTAKEAGIPRRQLITNGFFTRDSVRIRETAKRLADSGVNDVLLSADAFHQETIPLDIVRQFGLAVQKEEIPLRLQPAWLVGKNDENPYNLRTREILDLLARDGFSEGDGNVIFPEGNARKYLGEYFQTETGANPYTEHPEDIRCVSVSPNGDVLHGNLYRQSMTEILTTYSPKQEEKR
jgi:MoaA/NifB/PqqE/SkfB family radical SAM enzyme